MSKTRTTAIPLHGFVRFAILCDWRLCVRINRIATQGIQRSTGIRLRAELCDDKSNVDATTDEPEDLAVPHRRRLWFLRLIRVHPRNPRSSTAIPFLSAGVMRQKRLP